jgi:hypothetical protein
MMFLRASGETPHIGQRSAAQALAVHPFAQDGDVDRICGWLASPGGRSQSFRRGARTLGHGAACSKNRRGLTWTM